MFILSLRLKGRAEEFKNRWGVSSNAKNFNNLWK
jgi:hypothetical protein